MMVNFTSADADQWSEILTHVRDDDSDVAEHPSSQILFFFGSVSTCLEFLRWARDSGIAFGVSWAL